jgi:hypothetical protein
VNQENALNHRATVAALALAGAVVSFAPRAAADAAHQAGNFGVGIVGGIPDVGLSLNYFVTDSSSLQINPVVVWGDPGGAGGRIDYLFWPSVIAHGSALDLVWFFGPGGRFFVADHGFALGAELPVGLGLAFNDIPLDMNLEGIPALHILDDRGVRPDLTLGVAFNARYYF